MVNPYATKQAKGLDDNSQTKSDKKDAQMIALVVILAFMITSYSGVIIINAQQQQREWTIKQDGYEVNFEIVSQWDGHFNGKVIITSTSNRVIHNWNIIFQSNFRIKNIWNAKIESKSEDFYLINNAEWNQVIEVGGSREFGFTASNNGEIKCPTKIRMVSCLSEVKDDDYEVSYKVISDWKSGYTGEIKIKNLSQESIEDWVLEFQSKSDIEDFWSAELKEKSNGFYCIQNKGFNANIRSGDSLTIGIKGISQNGENKLTNICLKQVSYKNFFMADNDKDAVTNKEELEMGTDLDNPDSDSDEIPDGYEVYELET